MPFQIIRNDLTKVKADAIVNTANPRPVIGGGTDSAIYKAAGEELLMAERKKIGYIARGDAVSTPAFGLNAKYIIHTVGPRWTGGDDGEREILHSCYKKSLALADDLGCESIAFPLLATGSYEFPRDEALDIAMTEIREFLQTHEMDVTLVVFDSQSFLLSKELVADIDEYIDEHSVKYLHDEEYRMSVGSPEPHRKGNGFRDLFRRRRKQKDSFRRKQESDADLILKKDAKPEDLCANVDMPLADEMFDKKKIPPDEFFSIGSNSAADEFEEKTEEFFAPAYASRPMPVLPDMAMDSSWRDLLEIKEDTFQQRLFKLIDERGLEDPDVYKRANIDRKVFSKIRCNPAYQPTKKTAIALCIALKLDMNATRDLLSRAGLAMSPASKSDLIVSYFIEHKDYDIDKINIALFDFHLEKDLLGFK